MALSNIWKQKALERFPEITTDIEEAKTPNLLWFELTDYFKKSYEFPRNESAIKRIYDYADWCLDQPSNDLSEYDLKTSVALGFYEYIPTFQAALNDMPRWFVKSDVIGMKEIFSYFVGEEGFQKIIDVYDNKQSEI